MTKEEILARMDEAAKEDRERFFRVADTLHLQPRYADKLEELEAEKQRWRDMTALPEYPRIPWPMALPEWFPVVKFASRWDEDYLEKTLAEQEKREAAECTPNEPTKATTTRKSAVCRPYVTSLSTTPPTTGTRRGIT